MADSPSQKVAVVTGASSGIGRAIALRLGTDGYHVVVHCRRSMDPLQEVCRELRSMQVDALPLWCDFETTPELMPLVDQAWSWRGHVDVWVNNAGADILTGRGPILSFVEKLQRLLTVDVVGTIMLSRAVAQRMKQRYELANGDDRPVGLVLNMGWDQAWQGMEGDSGQLFGAAKAAVMAASKSMAQTYAPAVRFNCLAPGWIKTAWGQQAGPLWDRRARLQSLAARWGTPQDVASAAVFLASDAARFINGQTIVINGGFRYFPHSDHAADTWWSIE